jgi:dienelactone hydrolase
MRLRVLLAGLLMLHPLQAFAQSPVFKLDEYFAEPNAIPFAETELEKGQEEGWHWTRFRYTSHLHDGQPIRIHALYAVPDAASPSHKVPGIILTHGKFGRINRKDPRYWAAVTDLAKAGYAVLFYEWNPDPQSKDKGQSGDIEPSYSTFGTIDYSKGWDLPNNEWRDSMAYQTMIAGRRAVTWLSSQPEVDSARIGATGASFGGIYSSLLAAIDHRIKAVSPSVYAAGFGPDERGYNRLSPQKFRPEQIQEWRQRFDSEVILAQRTPAVPLLYIVCTNDVAFDIVKASRHFAALPDPKQIIICPNAGHDFWNFSQTVHFFNEVFQSGPSRPKVGEVEANRVGASWKLSVPSAVGGTFYYTLEETPPPDAKPSQPALAKAKWNKLPAILTEGKALAQLDLTEDQVSQAERLHIFATVKGPEGLEATSPLLSLALKATE